MLFCITDELGKWREKESPHARWECLFERAQGRRECTRLFYLDRGTGMEVGANHYGDKQGSDYAGNLEINHKSHYEV